MVATEQAQTKSTEIPDLTSPLKWAGGKKWLLSELRDLYKPGQRFVEPFTGGGSVPIGLKPRQALISDVNPHLMNFWRWAQSGLAWTSDFGIEFKNDRDVYYDNRSKFNALCEQRQYWTQEGALLFYYLNRTGFNGLCRFNNSGAFNVPFGKYDTVTYRQDFSEFIELMKGWELYCGDFETIPLRPDDFLYLDPPYDVEFTKFSIRDFTWGDQERLAHWAAKHKGPVIASNQLTARIVELYGGLKFTLRKIQAPRRISCTGDSSPADEILAIKYP